MPKVNFYGEAKKLELSEIHVSERVREDFGDLEDLAKDIAVHGLYHPILVRKLKEPIEGKSYDLLAGERRYRAIEGYQKEHKESTPDHMVKVECRVFNRVLSDSEVLVIEWHENFKRKDFNFKEAALMQERLHFALVDLSEDGRHKAIDTAHLTGQSKGTISQDLAIAKALQSEDQELREAVDVSTKKEAIKNLARLRERLAKEELANRARLRVVDQEIEGRRVDRKVEMMEFYKVCSFEEGMAAIEDRTIDLVELDPDWGIDFSKTGPEGARKGRGNMEEYVELPPEEYEESLAKYLEETHRVLKDHSWCLLWFSIRWYKETIEIARSLGFQVPDLPIVWLKGSGNSSTPAYQLANDVDYCMYLRKGTPRLVKMGRSNVFIFRAPHHTERSHPAEKPIELYAELLQTFTFQGSKVVVGFAGSGNALLAAGDLQRVPIGFDLGQRFKDEYDIKVANGSPGTYRTYKFRDDANLSV